MEVQHDLQSLAPGNEDCHKFEQIAESIFRWNYYSKHHKVDLTSHCVISKGVPFLFDPVSAYSYPTQSKDGCIVITNANHERASGLASVIFNMPIYAPEEVLFSSRYFPAHDIETSEVISAHWEVCPVTGGANGECIFFEYDQKIAIFGDCLINLPDRGLEVLPEKYCSDQDLLVNQLKEWWKNHAGSVRWMLFAHGSPISFTNTSFDMKSIGINLFRGR